MRVPQQNPHYVCFLSRKWQVGDDPPWKQPQFSECQCIHQPEACACCGVWAGEKRGTRNGRSQKPQNGHPREQRRKWGLSFRERSSASGFHSAPRRQSCVLNCWGMERFSHISWGGPGVAFRSFTRGLRISVLFHADMPTASNLFLM